MPISPVVCIRVQGGPSSVVEMNVHMYRMWSKLHPNTPFPTEQDKVSQAVYELRKAMPPPQLSHFNLLED